jgi:hypothetical protein
MLQKTGAEEESRTLDLNLGKVALYQLSYFRINDKARIIDYPNRLSRTSLKMTIIASRQSGLPAFSLISGQARRR